MRLSCARALGFAAAAIVLCSSHNLKADTITFDGLVGINGDAFNTYTEGIYIVTPTGGTWQEAHGFGNPIPDIFSRSGTATIDVTSSGGHFMFDQVDLGNANAIGSPSYQIEGLL